MPSTHSLANWLGASDDILKSAMTFTINGEDREFPALNAGATLDALIAALALKGDRVAVEQNGSIVSRPEWSITTVASGDKFEIVHFVGGGSRQAVPNPR